MITVIVCTYNRAAVLERMLTSFFEQDDLDRIEHEIIVVDNNSTDNTAGLVGQFKHFRALRYVFEQRQGLSPARNRGIAEARGEIVAFLDDDVIVDSKWLQNLQKCFNQTNADVVGGRSYLIFEGPPPVWLSPKLRPNLSEVELGPVRKTLQDGHQLYGLNLAFGRPTLLRHGGFQEDLGRTGSELLAAEESVLLERIAASGGTIVYEPVAVVGHIISPDRLEWRYFKRLYLGFGKTRARREPPVGRKKRLGRLLASCRELLFKGPALLSVRLVGRDLTTRYEAQLQLISMVGALIQRWQYLWRPRN